jgi:selenocysteine lyase/cysteine desulfurase
MVALARAYGARVAVDGAQLVPHRRVAMASSGIDYLVFSGHKLYAPFGTGVLIGKRDWLDAGPPYLRGGGAVTEVSDSAVDWAEAPARHEGGTPNLVGAVALAAACDALAALPVGILQAHERALLGRLDTGLAGLPDVRPLRIWPDDEVDRVAVLGFTVAGRDPECVAAWLSAEHGIGVRHGRFCAHRLVTRLVAPVDMVIGADEDSDGGRGKGPGSRTGGKGSGNGSDEGSGKGSGADVAPRQALRASLGAGSTTADVDRLVAALRELAELGPIPEYMWQDGRWQAVPRGARRGRLGACGT